MGVKINFDNDTVVIMGKEVALNITFSGHYYIPVYKTVQVEKVNAVKFEEINIKECKSAILLKLHRQFAHPPKKRLVALLRYARKNIARSCLR